MSEETPDNTEQPEETISTRRAWISSIVFTLLCAVVVAAVVYSRPHVRFTEKPAPVLVELFTSEGCSSCPPAEALLAELSAKQPVAGARVIPLAWHVDYWDRLGWKDRFSSREHTQRQYQYARLFSADGVYTPQMVVDGHEEFVGSDRGKAFGAIDEAIKVEKAPLQVVVDKAVENKINAEVSGDELHEAHLDSDLFVCLTEDDLSTNVKAGENAGKSLQHMAVVRDFEKVALPGSAANGPYSVPVKLSLPVGARPSNCHVVAFIQQRGDGRILAVDQATLR